MHHCWRILPSLSSAFSRSTNAGKLLVQNDSQGNFCTNRSRSKFRICGTTVITYFLRTQWPFLLTSQSQEDDVWPGFVGSTASLQTPWPLHKHLIRSPPTFENCSARHPVNLTFVLSNVELWTSRSITSPLVQADCN